jgi:phage gp16-like protein
MPSDGRRNAELAAIHTAKRQLRLDDDTYRAMLRNLTGCSSA